MCCAIVICSGSSWKISTDITQHYNFTIKNPLPSWRVNFFSFTTYIITFMNKTEFLERIDKLTKEGMELAKESPYMINYYPLELDLNLYIRCHAWHLSCLNLLRAQFGMEHYFYKNYRLSCKPWVLNLENGAQQYVEYPKEILAKAFATLIYIRKEFENGLVDDAKHLYEAALFSNLLEQAFELVEKGYLVGSAVYGRLVIENFINDLCRLKEVELENKDKLPQKLTKLRKKNAIDLPLERTIQAAYDIGTYAVHGENEFNKYTKEQILYLLNNIRDKILVIK